MWKYRDSSQSVAPGNWRNTFWKMVRLSLVLISIVSGWLFLQRHQSILDNSLGQHWDRAYSISGAFTDSGIQLDVVYLRGSSSVGPEAIRVKTPSQDFRLNDLSQLKGLLRITDANSALKLVQLRTAYEYDNCWPATILEVSCIDQEPGYRTTPHSQKADSSSDVEMVNSGNAAILSSKAYRLGGFHTPTVVKVAEGYQITRWVCLFNRLEGTQVQKWQETVSPDGGYHLQVLLSKPVSRFAGHKMGDDGPRLRTFPRRTRWIVLALVMVGVTSGCRLLKPEPSHTSDSEMLREERNMAPFTTRSAYIPTDWYFVQAKRQTWTTPNTHIDIVALRGWGSASPFSIRVTTLARNFLLTSMDQLQGLAHINSASKALEYVRMRTAPDYEFCWEPRIFEVSRHVTPPASPSATHKVKAVPTPDWTMRFESGAYGELSPEGFRAGNFEAPTVKKTSNGYVITRWVYGDDNASRVEKWEETVSPSGSYHRKVLTSKPLPNFPGTHWHGTEGRA